MSSTLTMKTCLTILLVALLCAERAQGLRCYQCYAALDGSSCSPANCMYPDGVCISQDVEAVVESEKVNMKNRFCLPVCPEKGSIPNNFEIMGVVLNTSISCCKEDLCNSGIPVGASTWALVGTLLFSLGPVLLQVLL